ncbi:MAG: family N-acetyltransferase [Bacteroidetes bacterium]|jgi:predicted amidohydrolase|nr:family N-acetyltransferase [Bacteroidota bacterium]
MKKLKLRKLRLHDYETITQLQLDCFPGMKPWNKEQFTNLITIFPQGQIGIELNGEIIASSCSHIINFDEYSEDHSWNALTANGMITNHTEKGDTLYGIEIMVNPGYRGMKLSRRLYEARQKLTKELNLKRIAIGGRIPNYHKYAAKMSAEQYIEKVRDKKIYDPVLTAQMANDFVLIRLLPNYLPNDKESLGYATFLEWTNYMYKPRTSRKQQYIRACAVQYQMRMIKDFEEFAQNCEYFVDAASDYRCDIILFPEMITMQLLSFLPNKNPGAAVRQLTEFTPKYEELFTTLAIKYNINIIGGSHFTVENDNLYNISYLFRRNGTIEKQYKMHITPHEKKWWGVQAGNKVEAFDTDVGKIAIMICYDVEFPELVRIAVSKGAQLIFVPFNTDERRSYLRVRYCSQARAIENQVYIILAGCVGNLPKVENLDIQFAQSAILTPSDLEFHREGIATEAPINTETLIFQDLDLHSLERNRDNGSVQPWKDRRTDFYKISFTENGKRTTF